MKAIFAAAALFVAGAFAQSQMTINTPSNVVECEPSLISWSGGTAPYYLSIVNGATPNGAAIESFPATNATSMTWTVNIPANTNIGLNLRDSTGQVAQSAAFTINSGSSTSCTSTTVVSAGATAATSAGASTAAATTGASASAGTTAAGSATASATSSSGSSSSGASANVAQFGAAGVVGAAVAALLL